MEWAWVGVGAVFLAPFWAVRRAPWAWLLILAVEVAAAWQFLHGAIGLAAGVFIGGIVVVGALVGVGDARQARMLLEERRHQEILQAIEALGAARPAETSPMDARPEAVGAGSRSMNSKDAGDSFRWGGATVPRSPANSPERSRAIGHRPQLLPHPHPGQELDVEYADADGVVTRRTITVRRVEGEGDEANVVALCHLRHAERRFRAARMMNVRDKLSGVSILDPVGYFADQRPDR